MSVVDGEAGWPRLLLFCWLQGYTDREAHDSTVRYAEQVGVPGCWMAGSLEYVGQLGSTRQGLRAHGKGQKSSGKGVERWDLHFKGGSGGHEGRPPGDSHGMPP